jgi:drug/metabolite transporter (DMT)-like permease
VGSVVPILPFVALTLLFDAEPTRWQWGGIALVVEALLEVIFGRKILQD